MTKAEATYWLKRLGAVPKTMPRAPMITHRQADAQIAIRQLAALIRDQVRVCEEAEAAVDPPR
jgi:hypothetical protein